VLLGQSLLAQLGLDHLEMAERHHRKLRARFEDRAACLEAKPQLFPWPECKRSQVLVQKSSEFTSNL